MLNITAVGNLGGDPELKELGSGPVATFSLGARTSKDNTTWISCSVFGKRAEIIMQYFSKGSRVTVNGRGNLRFYEGRGGEARTSLDLIVNEFSLPEKKSDPKRQQTDF